MERLIVSIVERVLVMGVPVVAGILAVSWFLDWRIGRGHRWGWPPRWRARGAKIVLGLINVGGVVALIVMLGPLRELAAGTQRFHRFTGEEVDNLSFRRVDDDAVVTLNSLRGQVIVLNLWGTWCPPCVRELPELDRLQELYANRGLTVVTLSQEGRERLQSFAADFPYRMTNVYAPDIGWLDVGEKNRPATLIIDRGGVLRDYSLGAGDLEYFEKMIRPYL